MITTLLFDFSWVLLFPKHSDYHGKLNAYHDGHVKDSAYQILDHFVLNQQLLDFIKKHQTQLNMYMFTAGHIQNEAGLSEVIQPCFEKIFTVSGLGLHKETLHAYGEISKLIGIPCSEILFIDDSNSNLTAAAEAGCSIIQYVDNNQTIEAIHSMTSV